jgi:xylulokinase
MPAGEPVLIGIDIGTSTVKAVMAAPGGVRLDRYAASHSTQRRSGGWSEQEPDNWLQHVHAALDRFASHPRAGDVRAIGITSQVNTHVFCDTTLAPLAPAITWQDTRASSEAASLDSLISASNKLAALGAPIPIDASHALSRMAWMAAHSLGDWARTRHVLLPKDWIIAQLTGQVTADPLSAVGLTGTDLSYAKMVLDLFPRAAEVLAPLRDPLTVAGEIQAGPFKGVPVATGTMDAWAAMFGLGVATEGEAMYLSGTSEVLGLISAERRAEPGIIVFPAWRGITLHAGPTQSGGASLEWLSRLLSFEPAQLDTLAAGAELNAKSPLFLPHLEGERAPIWDPSSRGAFVGLSSVVGPTELAASVMEGVAFSARLALEAVERSGGVSVPSLRHGGGGAMSDRWCQIRANALGRRLDRVIAPEAGAMGALVMGGVASGVLSDLATATAELVAVDQTFVPDPAAASLADKRYALYQDLYRATAPISAALAQN